SVRTREIRDVGRAMVVFKTKRRELRRHIVEGRRGIPSLIGITRICREIWCSRKSSRSVDGRNQYQVPTRIIDGAATKSQCIFVIREPEPVVGHKAKEILSGIASRFSKTTYAATELATQVGREGKCPLADELLFVLVIFDLNAVVRMDAFAVRI